MVYQNPVEGLNFSFTSGANIAEKLLMAGALNNDAVLQNGGIIGDPTEGALLVSAAKAGLDRHILAQTYPRVDEVGFTSERKMMTTVHAHHDGRLVFSKGAPEIILQRCSHIDYDGFDRPIDETDRAAILAAPTKPKPTRLRKKD